PVTGRLQGMGPTGETIGSLPAHPTPRCCAAVRKLRSAWNDAANVLITYVETLFGRLPFMKLMNCGVTMLAVRLMATSDRSTSPDVKKNVRSLTTLPPNPHEYSFRLKSGMTKLGSCF